MDLEMKLVELQGQLAFLKKHFGAGFPEVAAMQAGKDAVRVIVESTKVEVPTETVGAQDAEVSGEGVVVRNGEVVTDDDKDDDE